MRFIDAIFIFLIGSCLVACGGRESAGAPSSSEPTFEAGAIGAPADEASAIDDRVVHVHVARVDLGSGISCDLANRAVDYDRETHAMSWPGCVAKPTAILASDKDYPASSRVLSAGEAEQVEVALRAVTYLENPVCDGYDGEEYFMTTTQGDGSDEQKYSARNLNCTKYRLAPKIAALYDLLATLRD